MEQFYKGHRIEVSLSLDAGSWFVSLFIYYHAQATNILVTFSLKGKFTTYDEAVKAGLDAARRWVDTEKPVLDISTRTSGVTDGGQVLHRAFPMPNTKE